MNKKILIATGIYPPEIGGSATYVKNFCDIFIEKGFEICVITYSDKKFYDEDKNLQYKLIRVARVSKFLNYIKYFIAIVKNIKKYDFIYSTDIVSVGILCAIVKIIFRKKLILRLGGDFQWERALERNYNKSLGKYYKEKQFTLKERLIYVFSNFVLRISDVIIFNSELLNSIYGESRDFMKRKNIVIIKNILSAYKNTDKVDDKNILFAGRISKVKNIDKLIIAFDNLKLQNCKLKIIGDGPEFENIKKKIENHKNIELFRGVNYEQLIKEILKAKVVVNVSLTDINPNIILEALVLGKKVIITNESEFLFTNSCHENIYYVDPNDIFDIEKALRLAISNEKLNTNCESILKNVSCSKGELIEKHFKIFEKL
ncbi:MAG TPA: glycosyltransferase family 4 protein [bacterium]|nr:glycosyltransferase family 4 protein [bacterium]HOG38141.1 glycosyltransferase family 4 protein [bacterium]